MAKFAKAIAVVAASIVVLAFVVLAIGTSITVPMASAKDDDRFKHEIGNPYQLKEYFQILGITNDLNNKQLHHYTIYPKSSVGFSGPEVVCRGVLPKGLSLVLTDVLVSEWETILPRTRYVFSQGEETDICGKKNIHLREEWFTSDFIGS